MTEIVRFLPNIQAPFPPFISDPWGQQCAIVNIFFQPPRQLRVVMGHSVTSEMNLEVPGRGRECFWANSLEEADSACAYTLTCPLLPMKNTNRRQRVNQPRSDHKMTSIYTRMIEGTEKKCIWVPKTLQNGNVSFIPPNLPFHYMRK